MKNKKAAALLGLAAIAVIGGTFAYFTQTSSIDNPFDTAKYSTVVTEDFKPKDGNDWQPGAEVNKDVYVDNTGDRAVVVRVKFEDIWSRNGEEFARPSAKDTMTVFQTNPHDGEVGGDKSVVHKYFANEDQWTKTPEEDGYYYYLTKLEPGKSTGKFLDSVRLAADVDMGQFLTQYYYTEEEEKPEIKVDAIDEEWNMPGWKKLGEPQLATASNATPSDATTFTAAVTKPVAGKLGYSDADYILRVTIETVQATDKAVAAVFSTAPEDVVAGWELDAEDLSK